MKEKTNLEKLTKGTHYELTVSCDHRVNEVLKAILKDVDKIEIAVTMDELYRIPMLKIIDVVKELIKKGIK